jgi:single-strand DNA-binding protein
MSSVKKVILIGNLTRKPELRQTQSQTSVTTLSIATNDRRKNSSGEYENVAEYHDVVVFGRTAENCEKFLDKGRQVYVEGKLQTRKYTDKEGNDRRKTEILSNQVVFLSTRNQGDSSYNRSSSDSGFSSPAASSSFGDDDSNIPF